MNLSKGKLKWSKYDFNEIAKQLAPSKTWTQTLDLDPGPWTRTLKNLDPEKPGLRKTLTLKNLDPEKSGL